MKTFLYLFLFALPTLTVGRLGDESRRRLQVGVPAGGSSQVWNDDLIQQAAALAFKDLRLSNDEDDDDYSFLSIVRNPRVKTLSYRVVSGGNSTTNSIDPRRTLSIALLNASGNCIGAFRVRARLADAASVEVSGDDIDVASLPVLRDFEDSISCPRSQVLSRSSGDSVTYPLRGNETNLLSRILTIYTPIYDLDSDIVESAAEYAVRQLLTSEGAGVYNFTNAIGINGRLRDDYDINILSGTQQISNRINYNLTVEITRDDDDDNDNNDNGDDDDDECIAVFNVLVSASINSPTNRTVTFGPQSACTRSGRRPSGTSNVAPIGAGPGSSNSNNNGGNRGDDNDNFDDNDNDGPDDNDNFDDNDNDNDNDGRDDNDNDGDD